MRLLWTKVDLSHTWGVRMAIALHVPVVVSSMQQNPVKPTHDKTKSVNCAEVSGTLYMWCIWRSSLFAHVKPKGFNIVEAEVGEPGMGLSISSVTVAMDGVTSDWSCMVAISFPYSFSDDLKAFVCLKTGNVG